MIIFYNQKTRKIIGTIEGRVHSPGQLQVSISNSDIPDADIKRLVIGYEDTGKTEKFINDQGKEQEHTIYKEHNLHLWKHQLQWEDPKNPRNPIDEKIVLDKKGEGIGFEKKSP